MIYGVVLAGGRGERFWPLSRLNRPKQFLKLTSEKMMLEETMDRVLPIVPYDHMKIVTSTSMEKFILENCPQMTHDNILAEPVGRNTCAAIGLAAVHLLIEDKDAVMVVLSADHLIRPAEKLQAIIKKGTEIASKEECLMTIGIVPTRAETGYGYIKLGDKHCEEEKIVFYDVDSFAEKPKAEVAQEYYHSGNYLWNSGMFIWSAKTVLKAIEEFVPELGSLLNEYKKSIGTDNETKAREELYNNAESISIDFAVLEKAKNVVTVKADIHWDDIGGWNALTRYKSIDSEHNVVEGEAVMLDSYEMTVYNNADGLIACLGVSDLVVVRSDDITMVVHKTKVDKIKEILAELKDNDEHKKYL